MSEEGKAFVLRYHVEHIGRKSRRIVPLGARTCIQGFFISFENIIMLCTFVFLPDIPVYEINIFRYRKKQLPLYQGSYSTYIKSY